MTLPTLNVEILDDPRFWDAFFWLMHNEEKLREFAQMTGLRVERIRAGRRKKLHEHLVGMGRT